MRSTYNKFPEVAVQGYDNQAWSGWASISNEINARASASAKTVVVIDCYPGVQLAELEQHFYRCSMR